jgi:hypothetical protein
MLSRFTVPPLRSSVVSPMWNSLRCEWPPKSGSGSTSRIFAFGPKRSWYHLAAARPLAPAPTTTRSYTSSTSRTCRGWIPGPPFVEWTSLGLGYPSIAIVSRMPALRSPTIPVAVGG